MACSNDAERAELLEEIELLQAIYIHELELKGPTARPSSLVLILHPSTGDEDHSLKYVCLNLCLSIPEKYPFVCPGISIQNPRGLSEAHINSILDNLCELAKERTGSPMLYDLIEYTKECLTDNNIPSCPCVICLEHFHEETSFIKTECYHYFHSVCLGNYINHFLAENEKVLCPMCRLEIDFDQATLDAGHDWDNSDEKFVYKPDEAQLEAQKERQRILEYQKQKGGLINIEEERNKYLIEIKHVKEVSYGKSNPKVRSSGEESMTRNQEENLGKVGYAETQRMKERAKDREGTKRDKRGTEDRVGKNRVNSGNYRKDGRGSNGNGIDNENDKIRGETSCTEPCKRKSKNRNNIFRNCDGAEKRDDGHQKRHDGASGGTLVDNEERVYTTACEKQRHEAFFISEKNENGDSEKKRSNRKNKSSNSRSKQVNKRGKDRSQDTGTADQYERDNKSFPSRTSGIEERKFFGTSSKNESNSDFSSKSFETESQSCEGGGTKSEARLAGSKNSRKRGTRKPRQRSRDPGNSGSESQGKVAGSSSLEGRDKIEGGFQNSENNRRPPKKTQKFAEKPPGTNKIGNRMERTIEQSPEEFRSKKSSESSSSCDVAGSKPVLCRAPPGFEGVVPKTRAL